MKTVPEKVLVVVFAVLVISLLAMLAWLIYAKKIDLSFLSLDKNISTTDQTTINQLSPPEFNPELISESENVILIDLRDAVEYRQGHLEGAVNIPHTEVLAGNFNLPKSDYEIILYQGTQTGLNSDQLKTALSEKTVQSVKLINEPYENWASTQQVETGDPRSEDSPENTAQPPDDNE